MVAYLSLFCLLYLKLVIRDTDSHDDVSTGNHSEHSIQSRKVKKTVRIEDDTNVYVYLIVQDNDLILNNIVCHQVNLGKEKMLLNPPIRNLQIIVVRKKGEQPFVS